MASNELLNEREFELVNIIGGQLSSNQRDLSKQMNLSLGLVNMLLRRLAAKGVIRIQQLNSRKIRYILTPKGFSEKMRKSVKYTQKTINSISLIKESINKRIGALYAQGIRDFVLYGKGDIILLIDMIFIENGWNDCRITKVEEWPSAPWKGVLLICKETGEEHSQHQGDVIDLVYEISKENVLIH